MNILSLRKPLSVALLLVLFCSAPALAANVTVTATGDRSYSILGSEMDGVGGIYLLINYDSSSLSSPAKVEQGGLVSGSMFTANPMLGIIKIAIIRTTAFKGSGQIATISFADRVGTGGITSGTVQMIDTNLKPVYEGPVTIIGAPVNANSLAEQARQAEQERQAEQARLAELARLANLAGGIGTTTSVTFPSDQQQLTDTRPAPNVTPPVTTPESTAPRSAEQTKQSGELAADAKPEETSQYVVYKGILDRFKLHDGNKKLAAVEALFNKKIAQTIRQNPAILISNGQDKALLTIDIPVRIKSSPNFAVHGGTIVSFQQDKQQQGRWMVDVLPEKGSVKVTVSIIAGAEEFEYPLTVAPPVKPELTLDEKGWDRFIAETGTKKVPLHDFNNDGVRNYIDEYIFAANIITKKTTPERPVPATRLPAATPPKAGKSIGN